GRLALRVRLSNPVGQGNMASCLSSKTISANASPPRRAIVQAMRARADDAAVDDELFEIEVRCRMAITEPILKVLQYFQLRTIQRFLESVREANQKMFALDGRSARHNPHRATGMHERVAWSAHFHECDNLRSSKDVVRLVGHFLSEDTEVQDESEPDR